MSKESQQNSDHRLLRFIEVAVEDKLANPLLVTRGGLEALTPKIWPQRRKRRQRHAIINLSRSFEHDNFREPEKMGRLSS